MKLNEIFLSIDGEASHAGAPSIFVRTFGCNVQCKYCDSAYTWDNEKNRKTECKEVSVEEVVAKLKRDYSWCKHVTFTGGEPLLQKDAFEFINTLLVEGYSIDIETNGAVEIKPLLDSVNLRFYDNLRIILDYKSLSSGANSSMLSENWQYLREIDDLKCVVGSLEDMEDLLAKLKKNPVKAQVFLSPIFGWIDPKDMVDFVIRNQLKDWKVQLQIHKFIWDVQKRGV